MKFILASDHAGFELKEKVKTFLIKKGIEVEDLGPDNKKESVSYSGFGKLLGRHIHDNQKDLGIGICGTGLGFSYAVNRYTGVRGARITSVEDANLAKKHNNANILLFGGRQKSFEEVKEMINEYLKTDFEGGRHQPRIDSLDKNL